MQNLTTYQERHKNLLSLDFEFGKNLDEMWMENYEKVKSRIEKDINFFFETSKDNEGKRLGGWIGNQKTSKKENKLTPEKIQLMEELTAWVWKGRHPWIKNYNKTKSFIEINNQYPSYYSIDKEEQRLGKWIGTQKKQKKNDKLITERIKQLESLPNWKW